VSLQDQNTSVVDRLGEVLLENQSLESSLENVGFLESEDVIQFVLVSRQDANVVETAIKRKFEKTIKY